MEQRGQLLVISVDKLNFRILEIRIIFWLQSKILINYSLRNCNLKNFMYNIKQKIKKSQSDMKNSKKNSFYLDILRNKAIHWNLNIISSFKKRAPIIAIFVGMNTFPDFKNIDNSAL